MPLATACEEQLPFLWLTGGQRPDHNTLWRFYQRARPGMHVLFKRTVATAATSGLVVWAIQAVDGTKIGGNAHHRGVPRNGRRCRQATTGTSSLPCATACNRTSEHRLIGDPLHIGLRRDVLQWTRRGEGHLYAAFFALGLGRSFPFGGDTGIVLPGTCGGSGSCSAICRSFGVSVVG